MVNYDETIVTTLSQILPTYYELFCDSRTAKPCITYTGYDNYDDLTGDTLGFSVIQYMIKIWDTSQCHAEETSKLVDSAMRSLGFGRISTNELKVENNIVKMMVYSIKTYENY